MRLKVSEAQWCAFAEHLLERTDVESAGIVLARALDAAGGPLLVADELLVVPDDGYIIRRFDQIRIDPIVMNRMTQRARDEGLSIFTVHTHPMATDAWFSWADDNGDKRLMPSLHAQAPGPHGSIVIVPGGGALARAFDENGEVTVLDFDVVGRRLVWHGEARERRADDRFARQELALGPAGQARLRSLRVGVVGLGGVGSVVAVQLAHLGIGELVYIDGDTVSASNLSRVLGARVTDIGKKKVEVAARYVSEAGLPVKVTTIEKPLSSEDIALMRSCDVVFSCVDTHTPRSLLNALAYDALVPLIDMGTAFRVDAESGAITSSGGRVVVVGPGRPCLGCWGHLNADRLREEALSSEERAALQGQGYLGGVDVAQPSVVAFNTVVAGAAVIELLRLVTGFSGSDDPPNRLGFMFEEGTVSRSEVQARATCRCRR
ncbi:MAG: ThiF family adenylyltransferase [Deltaproteobacteria bacterium]|nr:ThiF family adenylyltransferase [Deltaproteobacteria bacterium]